MGQLTDDKRIQAMLSMHIATFIHEMLMAFVCAMNNEVRSAADIKKLQFFYRSVVRDFDKLDSRQADYYVREADRLIEKIDELLPSAEKHERYISNIVKILKH